MNKPSSITALTLVALLGAISLSTLSGCVVRVRPMGFDPPPQQVVVRPARVILVR